MSACAGTSGCTDTMHSKNTKFAHTELPLETRRPPVDSVNRVLREAAASRWGTLCSGEEQFERRRCGAGLTCNSIGWEIQETRAVCRWFNMECLEVKHGWLTCDMTAEPSSLVNTHRKAADGSKPWLMCEERMKQRAQSTLTLPLIATSAPPEASAAEGEMDDHEGSMSSGNTGDKSSDECETSTLAGPPAPVQVAQLRQRRQR